MDEVNSRLNQVKKELMQWNIGHKKVSILQHRVTKGWKNTEE